MCLTPLIFDTVGWSEKNYGSAREWSQFYADFAGGYDCTYFPLNQYRNEQNIFASKGCSAIFFSDSIVGRDAQEKKSKISLEMVQVLFSNGIALSIIFSKYLHIIWGPAKEHIDFSRRLCTLGYHLNIRETKTFKIQSINFIHQYCFC